MKTVIVAKTYRNKNVKFKISKKNKNIPFSEIEGAIEKLRNLYKKRYELRNRRYIDKTTLSKEFGKYIHV